MKYSIEHFSGLARRAIGPSGSLMRQRAPLLIAMGTALAAMAVFVQYRTRKTEQENPPAGKFVEVDGTRLHYLERGQGQAVVLLHGNGTMAQDFDISGVVDIAANEYRVLAFDRPGYGHTDLPAGKVWDPQAQAELLHRALQQLGVERPIIVAHSWGTLVAIALALEYPEAIGNLVLLSGYYYPTPRLDVPLLSPPAIPVIGHLMRYTLSPLIGRLMWPAMLKKLFAPTKTSERFKEEYPVWMTLRPVQLKASATEAALMIPSAHKLKQRYRELVMPVVIMAGAGDLHALTRLHSERLHKQLPESELIVVPGVGHMIQHAVPEQVLSAIDKAVANNTSKKFAKLQNPTTRAFSI